ncbi:hypothetical protein BABINDRAFT_159509 [Babjeviella inositovora NRRL Y-12698]|uniref:Nascent polypeptide-associated complex subunit alpha n=1 Tax=Babjeviella inositovora NRRL Y-12698 TaxID=984486 RepID=A0A1E3R119_9ASCO|nr:uncharacterized protein BABINDRAFT_159509 [Babjeviella inositovora NRRL Y-12698]ODQ83042.1 hypothetical protein BABINDRAFT_159509 [Babjeviella inositovora NRRL Y-12698]
MSAEHSHSHADGDHSHSHGNEIPQGADVAVFAQNESKARKAIVKLGLKQVKGISRVTFKRKGGFIVAIDNPDVYRSPAGSYVVFGEAKVDDLNKRFAQASQLQAQAQAAAAVNQEPVDKSQEAILADFEAASLQDKVEEVDSSAPVDESGLEAGDIEVIVEQTGASRANAVKALRDHNGDMVNAIMALTS